MAMNLDQAVVLIDKVRNHGHQMTDEEQREFAEFVNEVLMPFVQQVNELFVEVAKTFYRAITEIVDQLPEEVRIALRAQVKNDRIAESKRRHPSMVGRKITTVSPLERKLRGDLNLVPDGPDYMARRESAIQQQLSDAGVTANVMPLSQHPAYRGMLQ